MFGIMDIVTAYQWRVLQDVVGILLKGFEFRIEVGLFGEKAPNEDLFCEPLDSTQNKVSWDG